MNVNLPSFQSMSWRRHLIESEKLDHFWYIPWLVLCSFSFYFVVFDDSLSLSICFRTNLQNETTNWSSSGKLDSTPPHQATPLLHLLPSLQAPRKHCQTIQDWLQFVHQSHLRPMHAANLPVTMHWARAWPRCQWCPPDTVGIWSLPWIFWYLLVGNRLQKTEAASKLCVYILYNSKAQVRQQGITSSIYLYQHDSWWHILHTT